MVFICKSFLSVNWLLILIFILKSDLCLAQKNLKIGLGANVGAIVFNKNDNNDLLKTPYGFGLNIDYSFMKVYTLKTRLYIKSQKLNVPQLLSQDIGGISVPLILERTIYKSDHQNLQVGVEGGFSWDIISKLNLDIKDEFGLDKVMVSSLRSVSNFSKPNITTRIGIVVQKKLENNNGLQVYLHYIRSIYNWDYLLLETQKDIIQSGNYIIYEKDRDIVDLSINNLQCGIYYYFCLKCKN